ncbi:hypothetical protein MSATCC14277_4410 [Metamycoplasma salivarium]|uniref:hypothetical protein n=1 Tax=Metamycoplasma salivarium TaxID=2124 RepID=UPI0003F78AA7|nr:hypothetical protein [Metamycoplasma salivarium]GIZ05859.1 hypothetical protein MSATCC14277_4410 [Metamycoplasma salivarium]GIZ07055.1 hypothetical protein MSATCC33130_4090 [Metamycoplasma salivarium]
MKNNGATIFISTHLITEIKDYVDYMIFISHGEIKFSKEISSTNELDTLHNNYIYRKVVQND